MRARWISGLALLALPGAAGARAPAPTPAPTVEQVVVVMRHGVRPPTKDPAMPAGFASQAWPAWPVAPGWLTPHGARAVGLLGTADARLFKAQGLLPARGCPAPGRLVVVADSDQRTIATAQAWTRTLAPGCAIKADHLAQDVEDPRFNAIAHGLAPFDPAAVDAGVAQAVGPGGLAARDAQMQPLTARLNAILCGAAKTGCGVDHKPTSIAPATPGQKPKLAGTLDRASTAAQILLLEYAEGKPMHDVGWGRASAADVTALSQFHALEFALLARPRAVAAPGFAGLAPIVRQGLTGPARITMIAGHDTNVANLAGLIHAHWQVPGFAADDPAPGGAFIIERLRGTGGRPLVRVRYRAQTLDAIRTLAPRAPVSVPVPLPACALPGQPMVCPLDKFLALLG
ncbi:MULTISPECIES: histidine-type phosphatase [unclassified Sphingomonas]|uniref:histidine-type phosphatase n=1 Tax=Novosphingobium rhizosphaerae TaxID=1551649 RepID=UPI0015C9B1F2